MAWKKGPLPKGTWHWGGIVEEGRDEKSGFQIANFMGDHVTLPMDDNRRVEAHDISFYNNALTFPIQVADDCDCPDCKVT